MSGKSMKEKFGSNKRRSLLLRQFRLWVSSGEKTTTWELGIDISWEEIPERRTCSACCLASALTWWIRAVKHWEPHLQSLLLSNGWSWGGRWHSRLLCTSVKNDVDIQRSPEAFGFPNSTDFFSIVQDKWDTYALKGAENWRFPPAFETKPLTNWIDLQMDLQNREQRSEDCSLSLLMYPIDLRTWQGQLSNLRGCKFTCSLWAVGSSDRSSGCSWGEGMFLSR